MQPLASAKLRRLLVLLLTAAVLWFSSVNEAFAKKKKNELPTEAAGKSYVLPYALVIMGVALGLMVTVRPGRRADKAKEKFREEE